MRAHRSHSQLNAYQRCGHAYYLQRVARKPELPSVWLPAGKAFHTATEEFDRAVVFNDPLEVENWEDVFTDAFEAELEIQRKLFPDEKKWRAAGRVTKEKPNKEDVLWWHTFGRELMVKYIDWRITSADVWEIATVNGELGVEVEVTSPLGGVPMKGWVDRLLRSKLDGRLVVVDLKSGSRTPTSPMQLATYSIQLEELLSEPVLWGAWYNARAGALDEPINLSRWTAQLLGTVYSDLDRGIEQKIFLPNIDTHCKGCGVRDFCVFQGGREDLDLAA